MPRQGLTGVTTGAGTLLISEEDLFAQFQPFGLTLTGFRAFLRALGVPRLHMPNRVVLVDLLSFQLALRALNTIGTPDFFMPGHPRRHNSGKKGARTRNHLDLTFYRRHWRVFVEELLMARKMDMTDAGRELRSAMIRATDRITLALSKLTAETVSAHRARLSNTPYDAPSPYPVEAEIRGLE